MNQLPYTVDFKSEEVRETDSGDPFMTFFDSVARHQWKLASAKRKYEESREKLGLALSIPLEEQAKLAAVSMVSAFVKDVAYLVGSGAVSENELDRMTFITKDRKGETVSTANQMTITTDLQKQVHARSAHIVTPREEEKWSWQVWPIVPIEEYRREMPLHAVKIAAKLKEYGVFPQLGKFWVAAPAERKDPILYFQVIDNFVFLAHWD